MGAQEHSRERTMADTAALPAITLRSLDAGWNYDRWERELPNDGNRYEVIEGILYLTTAPGYFHQWIVRRLDQYVGVPLEQQGLAYAATAPIAVCTSFHVLNGVTSIAQPHLR
jgi:hypothetical protein